MGMSCSLTKWSEAFAVLTLPLTQNKMKLLYKHTQVKRQGQSEQ